MSAKQQILEKTLLGRTIEITATMKVTRLETTPFGTIFAWDDQGNAYKIDSGSFNSDVTLFNYEIVIPIEWGNGPVGGQIWRANNVDYAAMNEGDLGVILRPMASSDLYNAIYPTSYDRFLEMNPVLVKQA